MVKDIRYIIKRVIIGIVIAFILGLFRSFSVHALTSNFDSVLMCSNNMGCNTSLSLPYTYAYSDSARINFNGINFIQGKTYSVNFSMTLKSPNFSFNLDYPQLYVIDSSNNPVRAYPDRAQSLQVNNLGNDNYSVNWSFELDISGGNFTSAYVIFVFTSSYNQNIYSTTINSSNFLYYDLSDPTGNQDIINNQNNNTQNIINNNNSNTEEIINNQNENTEKEIESQKVCKMIDKDSVIKSSYYLGSTGNEQTGSQSWVSNLGITDYFSTTGSTFKVLVGFTQANYCFYNVNKSLISCSPSTDLKVGENVIVPNNASFVRFTVGIPSNQPQIEWCQYGNQAIQDSLTDDSGVSNKDLEDLFGDLQESNSPVSDLLTLPITLLQAYLSGFDSSCSTFNLGSLYGTDLILPCIDIPRYIGSTLWSMIDALCCIYMIYNIAMLFVSIYEQFTSLDDSFQLLYSPRHSGHTRVSRG